VILGILLVTVALFLSDSVDTLFRLFPMPVLGVILFFGGIELAASANGDGASRADRTVMVVTAGGLLFGIWEQAMARASCYTMRSEGDSFGSDREAAISPAEKQRMP